MGYMRHHAIVVTSYNEKNIKAAHEKALEIFGDSVTAMTNGYCSFFIAPDGSKEGWDTSESGDECRTLFIGWLNEQRFEDRSSSFDWVEVQYGDDENETIICRHSDEPT